MTMPYEGWLYLAVVKDLYSRKIIGWSMKATLAKEIVLDALLMAVWRRKPKHDVMIHSDQGSQFSSDEWSRFCQTHGLLPSMSRRGNCYDNGVPRTPEGDALWEMREGPLGIGLQDRVPNYVELLGLRASVVSVDEKASDEASSGRWEDERK